ncbi:MAG: aspartate-semialdehyde dehydrogenase [Deltaproteobacteria bacterium]|nr:aspartate-semialdehyde dehydrogenase [Deltaproteobacteria bacterium]
MLKVGIVGWRGMVGSVLMQRLREGGDFAWIEPVFFSTSDVGGQAPAEAGAGARLKDAYNVNELSALPVIITCQGGEYTKRVYEKLRQSGWQGYWIDAASTLRMQPETVIALDPVNRRVIDEALNRGIKTFVGGNCTVSLMIMALGGLFREDLIEWIYSATYQAASGAGAKQMIELMRQMRHLGQVADESLSNPAVTALEMERIVTAAQNSSDFPLNDLPAPLAGSLIPWIDTAVDGGQTREERKGHVELNKILQPEKEIAVDGICVRVGALRCHSQALCIKLKRDLPLNEIESILRGSNEWVHLIENSPQASFKELHPARVSGTLDVLIGRVHKLRMGPEYLGAFTVGDQLLWGAAEPLRRMLAIVREWLE